MLQCQNICKHLLQAVHSAPGCLLGSALPCYTRLSIYLDIYQDCTDTHLLGIKGIANDWHAAAYALLQLL